MFTQFSVIKTSQRRKYKKMAEYDFCILHHIAQDGNVLSWWGTDSHIMFEKGLICRDFVYGADFKFLSW
jgi:hypothetical protein